MIGEIGILNVGAGDTKISFNGDDPAEKIRAARVIRDMLRRGYALLITVPSPDGGPNTYRRAYDFDEKTYEYIIADLDSDPAATESNGEEKQAGDASPEGESAGAPGRGRPKTKRVSATRAHGVAVARSAGG